MRLPHFAWTIPFFLPRAAAIGNSRADRIALQGADPAHAPQPTVASPSQPKKTPHPITLAADGGGDTHSAFRTRFPAKSFTP
jgi:hypothetical protein